MSKLVFQIPNPDSPGYLRRVQRGLAFQEKYKEEMNAPLTASNFEKVVDFLVQYVIEPASEAEAREALWNASEEQVKEFYAALKSGGEPNPTP